MFEMASLFDDLNRQGSGSVLKSARGQARRQKALPAGRPTQGKPTQRCICASCWHTEVGGLAGRMRAHVYLKVDARRFYYLFYKF